MSSFVSLTFNMDEQLAQGTDNRKINKLIAQKDNK